MKKRIVGVAVIFGLCSVFMGPQKINPSKIHRESLFKKTHFTHDMANIEAFKSSIVRAARAYAHNPELFLQFLNLKTADGITPLMYASAVSGDEIISFLFDQAKKVFGSNKELFVKFINGRDSNGNTALFLISQTGNPVTIKIFLDAVASALKNDKELFYKSLILSPGDELWTPLHNIVYASAAQAMQILVTKAEQFLGKNSEYYNNFINAEDSNGGTPLSYSLVPDDRYFLIGHGATIFQHFKEAEKKALAQGDELIDSVKNEDLEKFKKILSDAQLIYKGKPNYFADMVSKRDESGWNALMHAAANGKLEFVQDFFDYVAAFFGTDTNAIYDIISNVATDGKSALVLAISRRHFTTASLILDKAMHYAQNKVFYYMFLNNPERRNGFTALISAAYNSSNEAEFYHLIKQMVASVVSKFGDSHTVYHFINAVDYSGNTALSYTQDPQTRTLLISYGAIDPHVHQNGREYAVD